MKKRVKYTRELLEPIVKNNVSVSGVMKNLGYKTQQGGSHSYLSSLIKKLGLDTSHFTGKASNRGSNHRGGPHKKSAEEVLVLRKEGRRQKAYQLRRALIEIGRTYQCNECEMSGFWQGKTLMLEVEHINRNFVDDRASNLKFLCPNCHSQTAGHRGSKGYAEIDSIAEYTRKRRTWKRKGAVAER